MTEFDRELVDKYFRNACSKEEASEVLQWFSTSEGKEFLQNKLMSDSRRVNDARVRVFIPDIDSAKMYREITQQTEDDKSLDQLRFKASDTTLRMLRAVAVILVMIVSAWFTSVVMDQSTSGQEFRAKIETRVYETASNEIRDLILSDGTLVRLNEESRLSIDVDYLKNTRSVRLKGEAYFDVERMEKIPFVVKANGAEIEVLGTAFNVNSNPLSENEIQLSVVEGKVRFRTDPGFEAYNSIIVQAGQFGVMNTESNELVLEESDPVNYLYWMSRRMEYKDSSLGFVCIQMKRIYGYGCRYNEEGIKNERFTATFSENGIDKIISVISLTLNIKPYINEEDKYIEWSYN